MPRLGSHPLISLAPGVYKQRNGLLLDCEKTEIFKSPNPKKDLQTAEAEQLQNDGAGRAPSDVESRGNETIRDDK